MPRVALRAHLDSEHQMLVERTLALCAHRPPYPTDMKAARELRREIHAHRIAFARYLRRLRRDES